MLFCMLDTKIYAEFYLWRVSIGFYDERFKPTMQSIGIGPVLSIFFDLSCHRA